VIKSRRMRWAGHVEGMEERIDAYSRLAGKPEGKRPLGRVNVDGSMILKLIYQKWDKEVGWIHLAQERDNMQALVSAVMNLRFP